MTQTGAGIFLMYLCPLKNNIKKETALPCRQSSFQPENLVVCFRNRAQIIQLYLVIDRSQHGVNKGNDSHDNYDGEHNRPDGSVAHSQQVVQAESQDSDNTPDCAEEGSTHTFLYYEQDAKDKRKDVQEEDHADLLDGDGLRGEDGIIKVIAGRLELLNHFVLLGEATIGEQRPGIIFLNLNGDRPDAQSFTGRYFAIGKQRADEKDHKQNHNDPVHNLADLTVLTSWQGV